jgi:transcriptional regulator with XRE-family HTH domain
MSPDKQLEDLLAALVGRFGSESSLGEVRAISYALRMTREGKKFSVSEVAKATGTPKQTLSRWLQQRVDLGRVTTQLYDNDSRRREITVTDPVGTNRHLGLVAEILGCDVDPPRRVQYGASIGRLVLAGFFLTRLLFRIGICLSLVPIVQTVAGNGASLYARQGVVAC